MKERKLYNYLNPFVEGRFAFDYGCTIGAIAIERSIPKNYNFDRSIEKALDEYFYNFGDAPERNNIAIRSMSIGPIKVYYFEDLTRKKVHPQSRVTAIKQCADNYKYYRSLLNNGKQFSSLKEEKDFLQTMYNMYGDQLFSNSFLNKPFKTNVFFMAFERAARANGGNGQIPPAKEIFRIYYKICKRNGLWLTNK